MPAMKSLLLILVVAGAVEAQVITTSLLPSNYKTLLVPGQKVGSTTFGELQDRDGKIIMANNYEAGIQLNTPDISNAPDYTTLVQVGGVLYASIITDFFPPSSNFLAKLTMDKSGDLKVKSLKQVNWKSWGGIWLPCSGRTIKSRNKAVIMIGEEYENNARHIAAATSLTELRAMYETDPYYYGYADVVNFMRYFGKYPFVNNFSLPVVTIQDIKTMFNPYMYGYITSMTLTPGGKTKVSKFMTMGRFSHELGHVMPDEKTVYLTDDHGNGGGIFKFVATKANDFRHGSLYAMKANQTVPPGSAAAVSSFSISWVLLGEAKNSDLLSKARNTTFDTIFELANGNKTSGACPPGFSSVNTATGYECLKLKEGMEVEAAFFETRRYAALLGATTEWSKAEGIAFDDETGSMYIAVSSIRYSMEDYKKKGAASTSYDAGGPNHIRLAYNPCGCIYKLTADDVMSYDMTNMTAVVCGVEVSADAEGNTCSALSIAGPDNLDITDGKLIIGEDSEGKHINNFMWTLDITDHTLTQIYRIQNGHKYTEAEFTSTYGYGLRGNAYLVTNVNNWDYNGGVNGSVGYFGPFKGDGIVFSAYNNSAH